MKMATLKMHFPITFTIRAKNEAKKHINPDVVLSLSEQSSHFIFNYALVTVATILYTV